MSGSGAGWRREMAREGILTSVVRNEAVPTFGFAACFFHGKVTNQESGCSGANKPKMPVDNGPAVVR
jgi:hypothetical protein